MPLKNSIAKMSDNKMISNQLLLLTVAIIAAGARFFELDGNSIWSDELYSLTYSRPELSLGEVLKIAVNDVHPPFYMGLLHVYFSVFPFNVSSGRGLSALFGLVSIIALYLASRESLSRSAAMTVAAMAAVHNFHFFYSQELRSYALVFFLATIGVWLWNISSRKSSYFLAIFAGACFALLSWTHYFGLMFSGLFVGYGVLLELYCLRKLTRTRAVILAVFCAGLAFLIPVIFEDLGTSQYWTGKVTLSEVAFLFTQLLGGKFAALISLILIVWTATKRPSLSIQDRHYIIVVVSFLAIVVIYSLTRYSMLIPRFSFVLLPLILILLASFCSKISGNRFVTWILIAALSYPTFFASVNVYDRRGSGHRLKGLVSKVVEARNNEVVIAPKQKVIETLFTVYGHRDMKVLPVNEHPASAPFWLIFTHNVRKPDEVLKNKDFDVLKSIVHKREVAYLLKTK